MTKEDFQAWLMEIREQKLAETDIQSCDLLGISRRTLVRYKKYGAPLAVALACQAILDGLEPYKK